MAWRPARPGQQAARRGINFQISTQPNPPWSCSPSGFTIYKRHLEPARPRNLSEASSARWLVTLEPGSEGRAQALCGRLGSGSAAGQGGLACHGVLTRVGPAMVVQGAEGDLHGGLAALSDDSEGRWPVGSVAVGSESRERGKSISCPCHAVIGVYEDRELHILGRVLRQTSNSNAQTQPIESIGSSIGAVRAGRGLPLAGAFAACPGELSGQPSTCTLPRATSRRDACPHNAPGASCLAVHSLGPHRSAKPSPGFQVHLLLPGHWGKRLHRGHGRVPGAQSMRRCGLSEHRDG